MRFHGSNWLVAVGLTLGLAACDSEEMFVATINGTNEVPAVTTNATGAATFTLIDNLTLSYDLSLASISNVTASHIHGAVAGQNGGVLVTLFAPAQPTGGVSGSVATGTITGADITGMSFDSLLTRMRNGSLYVNVHSTNFPAGEIRGQVEKQQ